VLHPKPSMSKPPDSGPAHTGSSIAVPGALDLEYTGACFNAPFSR